MTDDERLDQIIARLDRIIALLEAIDPPVRYETVNTVDFGAVEMPVLDFGHVGGTRKVW